MMPERGMRNLKLSANMTVTGQSDARLSRMKRVEVPIVTVMPTAGARFFCSQPASGFMTTADYGRIYEVPHLAPWDAYAMWIS
jgi:hypothetical protein